MLQIVFSDSECGTLKMATHWGPSSWDDGPIGFIFGDGEREPTQEEKDQAMASSRPNGRQKTAGRGPWAATLGMCYARLLDWTSAP